MRWLFGGRCFWTASACGLGLFQPYLAADPRLSKLRGGLLRRQLSDEGWVLALNYLFFFVCHISPSEVPELHVPFANLKLKLLNCCIPMRQKWQPVSGII